MQFRTSISVFYVCSATAESTGISRPAYAVEETNISNYYYWKKFNRPFFSGAIKSFPGRLPHFLVKDVTKTEVVYPHFVRIRGGY